MRTAQIIDGKALAAEVTDAVKEMAGRFSETHRRSPKLTVVLVGDHPASKVYVRSKSKMAAKCGLLAETLSLEEASTTTELLEVIKALNNDQSVDGILVQLPLPQQIDTQAVLRAVEPSKDVDGFHPFNSGLLAGGDVTSPLLPCTPAGIMHMIRQLHGNDLSGKSAVILGRSTIVGRPVSQLLLSANATVTIAHSRTADPQRTCSTADILVAAAGQPMMVKEDWIKPGATVIDVGINRIDDANLGSSRLVGDVDFDAACAVAGALTPVPGGVGPMTIAMLMANTLKAAEARQSVSSRTAG